MNLRVLYILLFLLAVSAVNARTARIFIPLGSADPISEMQFIFANGIRVNSGGSFLQVLRDYNPNARQGIFALDTTYALPMEAMRIAIQGELVNQNGLIVEIQVTNQFYDVVYAARGLLSSHRNIFTREEIHVLESYAVLGHRGGLPPTPGNGGLVTLRRIQNRSVASILTVTNGARNPLGWTANPAFVYDPGNGPVNTIPLSQVGASGPHAHDNEFRAFINRGVVAIATAVCFRGRGRSMQYNSEVICGKTSVEESATIPAGKYGPYKIKCDYGGFLVGSVDCDIYSSAFGRYATFYGVSGGVILGGGHVWGSSVYTKYPITNYLGLTGYNFSFVVAIVYARLSFLYSDIPIIHMGGWTGLPVASGGTKGYFHW